MSNSSEVLKIKVPDAVGKVISERLRGNKQTYDFPKTAEVSEDFSELSVTPLYLKHLNFLCKRTLSDWEYQIVKSNFEKCLKTKINRTRKPEKKEVYAHYLGQIGNPESPIAGVIKKARARKPKRFH